MAVVVTLNNSWQFSFMEEVIMSVFVFCVGFVIAVCCLCCEFCWCYVVEEEEEPRV